MASTVLAMCVAVSACSGAKGESAATTTRPAPTTTTTEAPLAAGRQVLQTQYTPEVGDCYDRRTLGAAPTTTQIVLLLPCSVPHQFEVYAAIEYPVTPTFPGTSALQSFARTLCVGGFPTYVGKAYETSKYTLDYELPAEDAWGNGIHHVIGCLLSGPDGNRVTGSAQGTKK